MPPQGLHTFLRAYYHMKSADWPANKPHPLAANTAAEFAKLPRYYVMDLDKGMAEQVAADMPTAGADRRAASGCPTTSWRSTPPSTAAPDSRAGCSRIASAACRGCPRSCSSSPAAPSTCRRCSSRARATGACSSAPAASRRCRRRACTKFEGAHLVDGAGHWVQQEQPAQVAERLGSFARQHS